MLIRPCRCEETGQDLARLPEQAERRDARQRRPVPVDLVFVWDKKKAAQFGELTAKDWFARKAQLRRDDPESKAFAVREWEWVPGQAVPAIDVAVPTSALRWVRAIYVFANYRVEGPHRLRLNPGAPATLALLRHNIELQSDTVTQRPGAADAAAPFAWAPPRPGSSNGSAGAARRRRWPAPSSAKSSSAS